MKTPDEIKHLTNMVWKRRYLFQCRPEKLCDYSAPYVFPKISEEEISLCIILAKDVLHSFDLQSKGEEPEEVFLVLILMTWIKETDEELTALLISCLKAFLWKVRSFACHCLRALGEKVLPALEESIKDGDPGYKDETGHLFYFLCSLNIDDIHRDLGR